VEDDREGRGHEERAVQREDEKPGTVAGPEDDDVAPHDRRAVDD